MGVLGMEKFESPWIKALVVFQQCCGNQDHSPSFICYSAVLYYNIYLLEYWTYIEIPLSKLVAMKVNGGGRCLKEQFTPEQIPSLCSDLMFPSFSPSSACISPVVALCHIQPGLSLL